MQEFPSKMSHVPLGKSVVLMISKEVAKTGREWLVEAVDDARHLDNTQILAVHPCTLINEE